MTFLARAINHGEWRANGLMVFAAMLGMSLSAMQSASVGVMMTPIGQNLGWSRTAIYSGSSLASIIGVFLATGWGLVIDRASARRGAIGACVLSCGAVAALSTIGNDIWEWWLLWLLIGVGTATMPTVWLAPINAISTPRAAWRWR